MTKKDKGMVMPFGKYKGQPIEELEDSYLIWLIENLDEEEYMALVKAVDVEIEFRNKWSG